MTPSGAEPIIGLLHSSGGADDAPVPFLELSLSDVNASTASNTTSSSSASAPTTPTNSTASTLRDSSVRLSPDHRLFLASGAAVRAGDLLPGDVLAADRTVSVPSIDEVSERGFSAPLTASGTLALAPGVLASCYAGDAPHWLSHWALAPLRVALEVLSLFGLGSFGSVDTSLSSSLKSPVDVADAAVSVGDAASVLPAGQ